MQKANPYSHESPIEQFESWNQLVNNDFGEYLMQNYSTMTPSRDDYSF
jgi:hypothetical protein